MAESRAKRLQIVLTLAERHEQAAAQQVTEWRTQVKIEREQLQQLEEYTEQYLQTYRARKNGLRAEELITYSGFIQRLGAVRAEQQAKLERVIQQHELSLKVWRDKHHRRQAIGEMIGRLGKEDNDLVEKRLQKELDELSIQQFQVRQS